MSTLKADTIQNTSGGPTTLTKQQTVKAYATVDAYQTTTGTTSSFNISSTTDDGTGLWDNAYTNNMSGDIYSVGSIGTGGADNDAYVRAIHIRTTAHTNSNPTTMLTSGCGFVYRYASASAVNEYGYAFSSFQIFGDLA